MPFSFIRNRRLVGMTSVSALLSFTVLNRWLVTDIGEKSFGRVWQYYVSWFDFGFHRRGLLVDRRFTLAFHRKSSSFEKCSKKR